MVGRYLTFKETSQIFSKVVVHFTFQPTVNENGNVFKWKERPSRDETIYSFRSLVGRHEHFEKQEEEKEMEPLPGVAWMVLF